MTAHKHTPGPWLPEANSDGIIRGIRAVPAGEVRKIINWGGISSPRSEQSQANARLILAADDLLAALTALVGVIDDSSGVVDYRGNGNFAPWSELPEMDQAKEAIAKAAGGEG